MFGRKKKKSMANIIVLDNVMCCACDNTEETKETDVPKKTGHWSLLYSPIANTTLMKCSCCEFTLEFDGRVLGAHKMPECPNCKAQMEDRHDDYSL